MQGIISFRAIGRIRWPARDIFILACALGLLCSTPCNGEAVYEPVEDIIAHVWTNVTSPDFTYPELSNSDFGMPDLKAKPSFGICVSGGGMRATTLAYGWVRALHEMGFLQKARYLSSNSGGSWFNGAFSYTQVPLSQFLGKSISPEEITMAVAKAVPAGSFAAAIAASNPIANMIGSTIKQAVVDEKVRAWSDGIGEAFLDPFGVGAHHGTVTTLGTQGRVASRVTQQMPANMPIMTAGTMERPFPIILGSIILPKDTRTFFPFEFTPLYFGSPTLFNDTQPGTIGGGFVEPLGFHSKAPAAEPLSPDGSQTVKVDVAYTVPLVQAVGVSSSFIAQKMQGAAGKELLFSVEQFEYWNQDDFKSMGLTSFGDGGGHDNQAITPLLRRGVEFIIAGSATVCNPNTKLDWAKCQFDIAGLYGAVPEDLGAKAMDGIPATQYNKMLQVFPREGYDELYNMHVQQFQEGGPAFYNQTLKVLPNPYMNIKGNYTVKVLWLLNSFSKDFESKLPNATRQAIAGQRDNPNLVAKAFRDIYPFDTSLQDFPLVDTFAMDYTPQLVTLLSQQASWVVHQAKKDIQAMLAAVTGTPAVAEAGDGSSEGPTMAEATKQELVAAKPAAAPAAPAAASAWANETGGLQPKQG